MKIKKIRIDTNNLTLIFGEIEFPIVLEKALKYIKTQDLKYYYFLCDDDFGTHDLSLYYNDYPVLEEYLGVGCFQIKHEHIDDITFMYKVMSQYHFCDLYINNDPNFLRFCNTKSRVPEFPKDLGYIIDTGISAEYIGIHKALDLPDWDLSKLGIDAKDVTVL